MRPRAGSGTTSALTIGPSWLSRETNSIGLDGSIGDSEIQSMIKHSYNLIVATLPRKDRSHLPTF